MISKKFRFQGRAGIRFAYRSGRTINGPNYSIKAAKNDKQQNYRLAVVVSKKVSKSAVTRNRIRRRIYEIVRANHNNITQPLDIIVTVHNPVVADMPADELKSSFEQLLKTAKITTN